MDWEKLWQDLYGALIFEGRWKLYLRGLGTTLQIAAVACALGIVLGLLVSIVKIYAGGMNKPKQGNVILLGYYILRFLNFVCNLYTTVVRGTPVVLQLLILYGMAAMPNGTIACMLGFGINSGAYVSEVFRGGINSVDIGQMEAGRSLGLSRNLTMSKIILPQAVKNILPALFNEFIALIKETSIAGYIAVNDLTKLANGIKGRTFNTLPFFVAALLYLFLTIVLASLQRRIERRLARSDRN